MEINIRKNSKYADVSLTEGPISIDVGLLDESEAAAMIETLVVAAQELEHIYCPDSTLDNLLVAARDVASGEVL